MFLGWARFHPVEGNTGVEGTFFVVGFFDFDLDLPADEPLGAV